MRIAYSNAGDLPVNLLGIWETPLFTERQLVWQWLRFLPGTVLYDREGKPLLLLDPGRRNRHAGPDILGAKFFYDRVYVTGAVECHLHENSWWCHSHHRDPRYASVVLHVVRQLAPTHPVPCPTVVLPQPSPASTLCRLTARDLVAYPERPIWQGSVRRWWKRVLVFQAQGSENKRKLLEACYRVLGTGGNEAGFEQLAQSVTDLPAQAFTPLTLEPLLKAAYTRLNFSWQRRGVRPQNWPQRRLPLAAALVCFLHKWQEEYPQNPVQFQHAFHAALGDFGGPTILTELLGNVFYPYLAGRCLVDRDLIAYQRWYRCWYRLALPTGYGKYRRQFEPLLGRAFLRPFWVWQGFIYLDKTYCRHRHCNLCPLRKDHGCLD